MTMPKVLLALVLFALALPGVDADRSKALHSQAALRGPGSHQRSPPAAGAALLAVSGTAGAGKGVDEGAASAEGAQEGAASAEAVVAEAERVAAHEESSPQAQDASPAAAAAADAEGAEDNSAGDQGEEEHRRASALQVKIMQARGLRFSDGKPLGVTDPYCVCEIPGKPNSKVQTLAIDGLHGVHWNHEGEIEDYTPGDALRCSVYERDTVAQDNFLGRVTLTGHQIVKGFKGELALRGAGAGAHAFLRLAVGRRGALAKAKDDDTEDEGAEAEAEDTEDDESDDGEEEEEEDEDEEDNSETNRKPLNSQHLMPAKKPTMKP